MREDEVTPSLQNGTIGDCPTDHENCSIQQQYRSESQRHDKA
jgi:hypothetical protein